MELSKRELANIMSDRARKLRIMSLKYLNSNCLKKLDSIIGAVEALKSKINPEISIQKNGIAMSTQKVGFTSNMKIPTIINDRYAKTCTTHFLATQEAVNHINAYLLGNICIVEKDNKLIVASTNEANTFNSKKIILKKTDENGGWKKATEDEHKEAEKKLKDKNI